MNFKQQRLYFVQALLGLLLVFAAVPASAQTIEIVTDFVGYPTRPQAPVISR